MLVNKLQIDSKIACCQLPVCTMTSLQAPPQSFCHTWHLLGDLTYPWYYPPRFTQDCIIMQLGPTVLQDWVTFTLHHWLEFCFKSVNSNTLYQMELPCFNVCNACWAISWKSPTLALHLLTPSAYCRLEGVISTWKRGAVSLLCYSSLYSTDVVPNVYLPSAGCNWGEKSHQRMLYQI